jgi:hypothetical protein
MCPENSFQWSARQNKTLQCAGFMSHVTNSNITMPTLEVLHSYTNLKYVIFRQLTYNEYFFLLFNLRNVRFH